VLACSGGPSARAATTEPKLPAGSQLDRELRNGTVRFLKGQDLSRDLETDPTFKASRLGGDVEGVARAFLKHFSSLWRLDDPNAELVKRRIDVDRTGASHVRFEQAWQGIPIPGAELIVHLDRDRRVVLVSGAYIPTPRDLGTTPKLDAAEARAAAAKETDTAACDACATELVVFAERGSGPRLAWRVAPPKGSIRGEEITVDAKSGSLLRRLPATQSGGRVKLGGDSR
jgi:Zn-dependent metalloprotease